MNHPGAEPRLILAPSVRAKVSATPGEPMETKIASKGGALQMTNDKGANAKGMTKLPMTKRELRFESSKEKF